MPTGASITVTQYGAVITLTWSANASIAGLDHYDVDVSTDNRATWSPVVANTQATSTNYTAQQGQSYVFRVIVTDNAGRTAQAETGAQGKRVTKYYAMGVKRVAMRADSVVYYLHGDHLGSTSLVTCGSSGGCNGTPYQGVVSRQLYHPYGSVRASVGTLPTDFTFTGQRADATGLMYFHARYYAAGLGRFVSADTIIPNPVNPQLFNRYSYARNNPLKYTDPTGHDACTGTMGTYEPDCGVDGWWGPPIEIWTEAKVNQARAEFTQASEFIVSMLAEPTDYFLTVRDCLQGNCSLLAIGFMFVPILSSRVGKYADDAVGLIHHAPDIGQMSPQEVEALQQIAAKYDIEFIVTGRRSETARGLLNREAALKKYGPGVDAPEFGVPAWRNTESKSINEFDYFIRGGMPAGVRRELKKLYGLDVKLDNWAKPQLRKVYRDQDPGGIVIHKGRVYRNHLRSWQ